MQPTFMPVRIGSCAQYASKFKDVENPDLYWLAGLLEGEGSFLAPSPSRPGIVAIAVEMTDEDVIARVADLLGVSTYSTCRPRQDHHKQSFRVMIRGKKAAEWMRCLQPLMGERRQRQIETALRAESYREPLISDENARSLAWRYWNGEHTPTRLGQEFGISKNLAIHYIKKFKPPW